ncbi:site-specific recombinase, phage integrase family [Pyramidobacter piscolens W5455]|uniref:Site-specific recombinase, phage integrase family n=1 Tax=Pyramidobacter piscolens W5455 TaxID=352165 RepID=A0ABM9ZSI0_9BACT|nr:site-specific integrase [Pyramidobacter piscolens]EFB89788.1 site-specific recombinase, phage integrase family [Pyramidobacter piscolens W5455]
MNRDLPKGIRKVGNRYKWEIMYNGVRRAGYTVTLEEAIQLRKDIPKMLSARASDTSPKCLGGAIAHLLATDWSEDQCKSHAWFVRNTNLIMRYFNPVMLLSEITAEKIDEYVLHLKNVERNSGGTINRKLSALSKILSWGAEKGYIAKKPKVPRLKESVGRLRFLSEAEEIRVLNYFKDNGYRVEYLSCIVLVDTGIRTGELFKASVKDVDWNAGDHGIIILRDTKNNDTRSVPLTKRAADALKELSGLSPNHEQFVPKEDWLRSAWLKMRETLGYADDKFMVPHILRHTCASRLVQKGAPLYSVAKWLGHRNLMTTRRYAHLRPDDLYGMTKLLE